MPEYKMNMPSALTLAGTLVLLVAGVASADVITLRSGEKIQCSYMGGTTRTVRAEVGGAIKTYDVGQIVSISFLDGEVGAGAGTTPISPAAAGKTKIPANSTVTVRMVDAVDSGTSHPGQVYQALVDEPVMVNGVELIARESPVAVRIVSEKIGPAQATLTLVLTTITIHGKVVPISSAEVRTSDSATGPNPDVAKAGSGTSAISNIVGGLGGPRAVTSVGSVAGGAINTTNQLAVRGAKVKLPPDTRLVFRTQSDVLF